MADKQQQQALTTFKTLCEMLDERGWHYERNDEKLMISCKAQGDDLPIDVRIYINTKMQIVSFISSLPFPVPEDKRDEMALSVSAINWVLVDGSFDYDYLNGRIAFRLTSSYRESLLSKELFKYVLNVSCGTVDDYNDKLFMVAKGAMTTQDVVKFINED